MIVYRLETVSGNGIFSAGEVWFREAKGGDPYRHPCPDDEGIGDNYGCGSRYRCGFASKYQLRRWFNKAQREEIAKRGRIVLNVYEVPEKYVEVGKFQCVFDPTKGKIIKTKAPNELDYA